MPARRITSRSPLPPITGHTRLAGVLGYPIGHTLSPAMHNAALRALGIDAIYVPLAVRPADVGMLLRSLAAVDALGVNVTIPHKQTVMRFIDECSVEAQAIGAVNTIVFDRGRLIGHNTDGNGFLRALSRRLDPAGQDVVLIGAGGAGRAVAVTLARAKAGQLLIVEPDPARRTALVRHLRRLGQDRAAGMDPADAGLAERVRAATVVINASPLGLKPRDPWPVDPAWISPKACVMDLAYGQQATRWLRRLAANGRNAIPGWEMLLYQGAEAFRHFTGRPAPEAVMREALRRAGVALKK